MKVYIDSEHADEDLPTDVLVAIVAIERTLLASRAFQPPQILRFAASDGDDDCWRYEIEIELAPGLKLPVECGLLECEPDDGRVGADEVASDVAEGVAACLPQMDRLGDILHDARLRARRTVGAWHRSGLQVRLIDVRLAPYDHWRGQDEPSLQVVLEGMDDRLEPRAETVSVERPEQLEHELEQVRANLAADLAAKAELMKMGASGTIDRLALNALASAGDVSDGLRRLAREWRFWLEDDTAIVTMGGHVRAGNGDPDARVQWTGNCMSVAGLVLTSAELSDAVGKPASSLFPHPFFSPDMTVIEARTAFDQGMPRLQIEFVNRKLAFCSVSGRAWEIEDISVVEALAEDIGSNVVPLVRKRPAA